MSKENTFDVVSKVEMPEVLNAVQQATKEILTRYDLKDSHSSITLNEKDHKLMLASGDEYKLKAVIEVLQGKLVRRGVSTRSLSYGAVEGASGGSARQEITIQQGLAVEKAKEVVKALKDAKLKVQASIQGDTVRVAGKDRDVLQEAIAFLKKQDFGVDLQFTNYRSN
ncbi:MAG: YajQ family cyclic di-GMP-binding protein [Terriglobales bacterium]